MTRVDETQSSELTVEFGPLEARGILLGISGASLMTLAFAAAVALGALFLGGGGRGLLVAVCCLVAGGVAALTPVRGATISDWAGLVLTYTGRVLLGRRSWRSSSPTQGTCTARRHDTRLADLPVTLAGAGTRVISVPWLDTSVGVVIDGHLAVGVLAVRSSAAFLMRQPAEQAAATAEWAEIIGSVADPGSPFVRMQWCDTTAPVDTGALARFLADAMTPAARVAGTPQHAARLSYEALVRTAAPAAEAHEILLALAVDPRRVTRETREMTRHRLSADEALGRVVVRHLEAFAYRMAGADLLVEGMLTPRQLGAVLRAHADPAERLWQTQPTAEGEALEAGLDPSSAWLLAADETFSAYRTDGAWHATLWVQEWSRRPVRIDVLAPLLLRCAGITRTLSVTMAPVDPGQALRQVEDVATADASDEALRDRWGIRTSGRRRRETASASRREEELLDGYDDVRFSGYVTVSAPTAALLEDHVREVQTQARAARLRLMRLVGQQPEAFWYTAPLCRGVR